MKTKKTKVLYIGTSPFGLPALRALLASPKYEIIGVITQPDRKVGREQKLSASAIKQEALKARLKIYQPEKIKQEEKLIKELSPDIIVLAAYGQIIPESILNIPPHGCINIHGSLLPKYRGASCVQAAILNGDRISGVTIMKMDKGLDTGPILAQRKTKIHKEEYVSSLHDRLAELGGKIIVPTLNKYLSGKIKAQKQNDKEASYVKILKKEDGHIDWAKSAVEIERITRAYNPWPGSYSYLNHKKLDLKKIMFKILAVRPKPIRYNSHQPGEIFMYNNALAVQCGQNSLVIIKLQIEGKKAMEVDEFLRGNIGLIGSILE